MQLFDAGKNVEADLPGFVATGCIVLQNLPLSETACRASGFLSVPIACIAKENGIVFDKNLPSPTAEKMVHFCTVLPLLYHTCNRFARLFHRFFPFFIEKVQLEIQKIRQFCARNTKISVDFTRESPFSQQFPVLSESSFFQNSPLILEIRMRIYRILLVPETIPCYNKKSICGDHKPTLLFYVLAFYPFSLMPAVFSALPVGKVWRKQQLQMHQKQSIINIISGINDAGAASPAGNSRTAILGFIFSCIEERRKNLWRKNNSRKKRN